MNKENINKNININFNKKGKNEMTKMDMTIIRNAMKDKERLQGLVKRIMEGSEKEKELGVEEKILFCIYLQDVVVRTRLLRKLAIAMAKRHDPTISSAYFAPGKSFIIKGEDVDELLKNLESSISKWNIDIFDLLMLRKVITRDLIWIRTICEGVQNA